MRILNVMFGRELGGIEQAFLDYSQGLMMQGHTVIALIHPEAAVAEPLSRIAVRIKRERNSGAWDFMAVGRLRLLIEDEFPDIIVAHGNRAIKLMKKAAAKKVPVVGVAHNYKLKHIVGTDAALGITKDICERIIQAGQPEGKVFHVPNMIYIPQDAPTLPQPRHDIPVIGTMGRMVKKKGFADYLQALSILKSRDIPFKAILGGEGEEEDTLRSLARSLNITDVLTFSGWVRKKKDFFDSLDIFCLPSLHEPFGIILLEAFMHAKPVVTTASEGPSEIATHEQNALLVPTNDPNAIADALERLIKDRNLSENLAISAAKHVRNTYSMEKAGAHISAILVQIMNARKAAGRMGLRAAS